MGYIELSKTRQIHSKEREKERKRERERKNQTILNHGLFHGCEKKKKKKKKKNVISISSRDISCTCNNSSCDSRFDAKRARARATSIRISTILLFDKRNKGAKTPPSSMCFCVKPST